MKAITMPKLSHYVTDGKVLHWYKREGETVKEGELLLEIETIKATTEILAPSTGTVAHIFVDEDVTVGCETLLAEIEE
jgi:pyruvate dehydrogenase E2 component (dihydrolipoamide acetyltransferase)